jgi:integrase
MAKPWKIKPWPYLRKDGKKSWRLGYVNHEKKDHSKAFSTAHDARTWTSDYITAERRGKESLRRFLLDLDAKEANAPRDGKLLGDVVVLFLAHNRPEDEGGLAPSTHSGYRYLCNRHLLGHKGFNNKHELLPEWPYAQRIAMAPAADFNEPDAPREFNDEMIRAGISLATRQHAYRALSACISWAAGSALVPEITTNGCLKANEQKTNKRRSGRRGGKGVASSDHRVARQGADVESWALSALAVEHIRARMLTRTAQRNPLIPQRDAVAVSLQFGLGARNQEIFGLRWGNMGKEMMDLLEVISWGRLDEGKTYNSTPRQTTMPSLLIEDLKVWKSLLRSAGHSTRDEDFIISGDLAGSRYGVRDPRTGGCHFTRNQAGKWGPKYFTPMAKGVAKDVKGMAGILAATEYSLRRGGISTRLRSEDPQTIAAECGTSLQMLDQHYSFALKEYLRQPARPIDVVWREARRKVSSGGDQRHLRVVI